MQFFSPPCCVIPSMCHHEMDLEVINHPRSVFFWIFLIHHLTWNVLGARASYSLLFQATCIHRPSHFSKEQKENGCQTHSCLLSSSFRAFKWFLSFSAGILLEHYVERCKTMLTVVMWWEKLKYIQSFIRYSWMCSRIVSGTIKRFNLWVMWDNHDKWNPDYLFSQLPHFFHHSSSCGSLSSWSLFCVQLHSAASLRQSKASSFREEKNCCSFSHKYVFSQ